MSKKASDRVLEHFDTVAYEAGLEVMGGVLGILWNREVLPKPFEVTEADVVDLYESYIGPAIDRIEKERL